VLLILGIGSLMGGANFEQSLLLGNSTNIARSQIIEVYVYNQGLVRAAIPSPPRPVCFSPPYRFCSC
jgi:ABC-type polysaccharide transport system permease subunit